MLLNRDPEYVGDHKARINWRRDGRNAIDRKRCDEASSFGAIGSRAEVIAWQQGSDTSKMTTCRGATVPWPVGRCLF